MDFGVFEPAGIKMSKDTCYNLFHRLLITCIDRESGGDWHHFKGGAIQSNDGKYSLNIDCTIDYCP